VIDPKGVIGTPCLQSSRFIVNHVVALHYAPMKINSIFNICGAALALYVWLNQLIVCQHFSINKSENDAILKIVYAKQPSIIVMEGFSYRAQTSIYQLT